MVDHVPLGKALRRGRAIPAAVVLAITLGMSAMSLLPGFEVENLRRPMGGPSAPSYSHPFGTDELGYGLLRQIVARSAAYIPHTCMAVLIAVVLGCAMGSVAGYFGAGGVPTGSRRGTAWGWASADQIACYLFELAGALPRLAVLFLIYVALPQENRTFYVVSAAVGVAGGMKLGAIVRSEIISLRRHDHIEAAVEVGLPDVWILWRHLITTRLRPLVLGHAFQAAAELALVETTLRFFFPSFGVPNSWGELLIRAKSNLLVRVAVARAVPSTSSMARTRVAAPSEGVDIWWVWAFPAVFITANIIALYMVSDAVSGVDNGDA